MYPFLVKSYRFSDAQLWLPVDSQANEGSINNQRASLHQQSAVVTILAEKMIRLFADVVESILETLHVPVKGQLAGQNS